MRRCDHPKCREAVPYRSTVWIGQQLEWAQDGGWVRPLCAEHETSVPVEFVLTAQSRQAVTAWATPIDVRDQPDDDEGTTTLRDLTDLMSINPDLVHGSAGLIGTDPLIHMVRSGLLTLGTEMARQEKLRAQDLTESKGGEAT